MCFCVQGVCTCVCVCVKLQEELDAIKAEKEALAAVSATDAASPSANIESALAPY